MAHGAEPLPRADHFTPKIGSRISEYQVSGASMVPGTMLAVKLDSSSGRRRLRRRPCSRPPSPNRTPREPGPRRPSWSTERRPRFDGAVALLDRGVLGLKAITLANLLIALLRGTVQHHAADDQTRRHGNPCRGETGEPEPALRAAFADDERRLRLDGSSCARPSCVARPSRLCRRPHGARRLGALARRGSVLAVEALVGLLLRTSALRLVAFGEKPRPERESALRLALRGGVIGSRGGIAHAVVRAIGPIAARAFEARRRTGRSAVAKRRREPEARSRRDAEEACRREPARSPDATSRDDAGIEREDPSPGNGCSRQRNRAPNPNGPRKKTCARATCGAGESTHRSKPGRHSGETCGRTATHDPAARGGRRRRKRYEIASSRELRSFLHGVRLRCVYAQERV